METITVKKHLVIEDFDENGKRFFREEDKIEEVEVKTTGRHHILCNICGRPNYPDCMKTCQIGRNHPLP